MSASADEIPDLSRRVTKLAALADRAGRWSIVRALLIVVAVEIIAFSLPALVLGDEQGRPTHAARHLGAFTAAYGVGLLVVAVRPARARHAPGRRRARRRARDHGARRPLRRADPLVGEAQHLPEVLSVVLVWLLAIPSPRRPAPRRAARTPLTAVPDEAAG